MNERLYFLAILPTQEIQDEVTIYKQYAADHYNSRHALKSPPHITLIPPFWWEEKRIQEIEQSLKSLISDVSPFNIELKDFNCFKPRVIYVNIVPSEILSNIQSDLKIRLKTQFGLTPDKRPDYHPHMTVAFKDLSKTKFYGAWDYFQHQSYTRQFEATQLTILTHQLKRWNIVSHLLFSRSYTYR